MKFNSVVDTPFFSLSICIGVSICAFLVVLFYRNKMIKERNIAKEYQKIFSRSVMQVVEYDRERISGNIHDEVGTVLSIIKLNLSKIARNPADVEQAKSLLNESMNLLTETIEHTREISMDLISPTLNKLGYKKGIIELCRQINISNQINVSVINSEGEVWLLPVVEKQLYRVVKEVLNNIIKHASSTKIIVTMKSDKEAVTTEVWHDGIGLNPENVIELRESANGVGLNGIYKQLELIEASIDYSTNGKGESRIIVKVPCYEENN